MYPYGFGLGSHWLLYIGIPLIIGIWAQIRVSSAFSRWSKVRDSANITGAECAREILQAAQIHDVDVVETNDFLGDHYDPTNKKLHLSSNVYHTPSVAAVGIAAHETGHAIQHAKAYAPLKARMAIVQLMIRWGMHACQCARCSHCCRKGASLRRPIWSDAVTGWQSFPVERVSEVRQA